MADNDFSLALKRLPAWATIVIGCLFIAMLAGADYITGYEIAFSIFYLIPVLYVTWYAGLRRGTAVAVLAATVWGTLDTASGAQYSAEWIPVWNTTVRLGFYMTTANLLDNLHQAQRRLREIADTDSLTGIANARSFYSALEREVLRQQRYGSPFTLAYIDLDHFKDVNDRCGHLIGDDLLRSVAVEIRRALRGTDMAARLGGDEFGILLPETSQDSASRTLSRIHAAITHRIAATAPGVPGAGATIGAVVFESVPESADAAVGAADALMYEGKAHGRGVLRLATWTDHGLAEQATGIIDGNGQRGRSYFAA